MSSSLLFVCGLTLLFVRSKSDEWLQTPHGLRPKECVIQHTESNVIIDKSDKDGLMIYYPLSNRSMFYQTSPKCLENARGILSKYGSRNRNQTANAPGDGWEIYAHFGQSNLARFDAEYIVPNQQLPTTHQLLYYFIGLTNFDQNETIIQPVLTWCGSASCGYSYDWSGWQMAAWNCCPNGLSNYGKGVKLNPGDAITTYVQSEPNTGSIQVYMSSNNGVSSLNENGDYRAFNDAEITGEFYSYSSCDQFNSVPVQFKKMSIKDTSGNAVNIPPSKWSIIDHNPLNCGGNITVLNETYATIKARQ